MVALLDRAVTITVGALKRPHSRESSGVGKGLKISYVIMKSFFKIKMEMLDLRPVNSYI